METLSPILWQNEDRTVTLLDIPRSIAAAQGTRDCPFQDNLLSTKPLETPYTTNEPKSVAAKAKVINNTVDAQIVVGAADLALTGGQQEFKSLLKMYARMCHVGVVDNKEYLMNAVSSMALRQKSRSLLSFVLGTKSPNPPVC